MILPLPVNYFLGCSIGNILYYLLAKKRRLAIKNLKNAFPGEDYKKLSRVARKSFKSLALNIIETLSIPRMSAGYVKKYVAVENLGRIKSALLKGKGAIMLAYHFGNWEVANVTSGFYGGVQGYNYKVVVNEQRHPLLNGLLNRWREAKGCKAIPRGMAIRGIIKALRNNEVVAMVGDQGGKEGRLINFLGQPAPMPEGAARFALNGGAVIVPALIVREKMFHQRIILEEPLAIEKTTDAEADIEKALLQSSRILENYIKKYPHEYFWFYKIWKYSPVKSVVILSDGKTGHLRQSQAVLNKVNERLRGKGQGLRGRSEVIEVRFKNRIAKVIASIAAVAGIDILRLCLKKDSYRDLKNSCADIVVSCGSSLAAVNLAFAKDNLAKSICVMKPPVLLANKFDLIIAPRHDNSARGKNVFITEGALNLIDGEYLSRQAEKLKGHLAERGIGDKKITIGLLIGGGTQRYKMAAEIISVLAADLKKICSDYNARLLVTTSRRTSKSAEVLLKKEFGSYDKCPLLVIANDKNIPEAVGGILGLSDIVVVSNESISMVSEAASSGKYALAFRLQSRGVTAKTKHEMFLNNLADKGFVYVVQAREIADKIRDILTRKPQIQKLDDSAQLEAALKRVL